MVHGVRHSQDLHPILAQPIGDLQVDAAQHLEQDGSAEQVG